MALRDIFDSDPRSKDQLREELRLHGKVISDLSRQLDQLNETANFSALEVANLRHKLLAERQFFEQTTNEHATAGSSRTSVEPSNEPRDLGGGTFESDQEAVESKKKLVQQLVAALNTVRVRRTLAAENAELKLYVERLADESADLTSKLSASLNTVARLEQELLSLKEEPVRLLSGIARELSDRAKPLADRERLLFKNFVELQRREALLMEANSAPSQIDSTSEVLAGLPERSIASMRQESNEQTQELEKTILELRDRLTGVQIQLSVKSVELAEQIAMRDAAEVEMAAIQHGVGSDEWSQRRGAEQRDHALESLQYQLDLKLLEYKAQVDKFEKRAAEDSKKVEQLRWSNAQKVDTIDQMSESIDGHLEDIRHLKSKVASLEEEARETAIQIHVYVLSITNLREEIRRSKQLTDGRARILSMTPPTFSQEDILTWMFSETSPDVLQVEQGYLHLMGDGPWDNDAFGRLMEIQDFSLWKLPDADISHLVVGRNNWREDDLIAQIEARQGQSLRIYSQEMWFAAMATGRDPFDAEVPELLQAFAADHDALQFLIAQEMPWPKVSDGSAGDVTPVGPGELGVLESPMHLMDYRVGKTSPHSEEERQAILNDIFSAKSLMFGDDCSSSYRANWGNPKSAQRLYRMATHIKTMVDGMNGNDYRRPVARQDWISDLAWLKKTYFRKTVHAFKWPDTHVP